MAGTEAKAKTSDGTPPTSSNDVSANFDLDSLRLRVKGYLNKHLYQSALFWADKLVTLSDESVEDLYWYAQTLFLTKQFQRASHLIRSRKLDKSHITCRYLAAKCHYECNEWQEALDILDMVQKYNPTTPRLQLEDSLNTTDVSGGLPIMMESTVNLLRGQIYEAMDNRNLAAECFREALRQDVYCYEAFELLVNHHMLTATEEKELLDSLQFETQCSSEEHEMVKFLYTNSLKKYDKPGDLKIPSSLGCLQRNLDLEVSLAERHYYNCDFRRCFKITSEVLAKDPYNSKCLPLHIAVLVELGKPNILFYLAHKLVDIYPSKPVSWFAVGCYYYLIEKYQPARRYLSKATSLDRSYGPAWLAFGHSFGTDNEHDQAMAAYFTASQLMKGCHLPVLYIGLEYGLTNNTKLADRFFCQALHIAPEDPFVLHEIGVIAFQNHDWLIAEGYFTDALSKIQPESHQISAETWEPLLNNLAHTYRKLKNYEKSLEFYKQALVLSPQNPSTYSAIGYVHAIMGNNMDAMDYFHKALGIRRDDAFSTTMLDQVMESLMKEMSPCEGLPDALPTFECSRNLELSQADISQADESQTDVSQSHDEVDDSGAADTSSMIMEVEMDASD